MVRDFNAMCIISNQIWSKQPLNFCSIYIVSSYILSVCLSICTYFTDGQLTLRHADHAISRAIEHYKLDLLHCTTFLSLGQLVIHNVTRTHFPHVLGPHLHSFDILACI